MARPRMVAPEDEVLETPVVREEKKVVDNFFPIEDLPTRYALYPKGAKLYGRPLTVKEVKKLSAINENNFDFLLTEILSSATRGINVNDIYVADKIYIIFWLRANTYKNADFTTPYVCDHCKRVTEYSFDVNEFDIKYLAEDFKAFELTLLNNGSFLTFDYQKIGDEAKIEKFNQSLKNGLTKFDDDTIQYASMIKTINGANVTMRTACEFIDMLDAEDYAYMKSYLVDNDIGVIPTINATCGHADCKEVSEVLIGFRSDFFIPKFKFR